VHHFGFIFNEKRSEQMATNKAAMEALVRTVYMDDMETT